MPELKNPLYTTTEVDSVVMAPGHNEIASTDSCPVCEQPMMHMLIPMTAGNIPVAVCRQHRVALPLANDVTPNVKSDCY